MTMEEYSEGSYTQLDIGIHGTTQFYGAAHEDTTDGRVCKVWNCDEPLSRFTRGGLCRKHRNQCGSNEVQAEVRALLAHKERWVHG